MRMRERMQGFMAGRYGTDQLSKLILWISLACLAVSMFTRLNVFYILGLVLLIYTYYRMFSRNVAKRYAENQKYLQMTSKFRLRFNKEKNLMKQRKTHHIYSCPGCGQKVRIPRGKGKIEIECPKCHTKFVKRS